MSRKLVAVFSATGTTLKTAEELAEAENAQLYEIRAQKPYSAADLDWMDKSSRSTVEMKDAAARPALADHDAPVAETDVIFVGYPIWWNEAPRVVDTFLESYDFSGKTIVPFATSGGSSITNSEKRIRDLVPSAHLREGLLMNHHVSEEVLKEWADQFK